MWYVENSQIPAGFHEIFNFRSILKVLSIIWEVLAGFRTVLDNLAIVQSHDMLGWSQDMLGWCRWSRREA